MTTTIDVPPETIARAFFAKIHRPLDGDHLPVVNDEDVAALVDLLKAVTDPLKRAADTMAARLLERDREAARLIGEAEQARADLLKAREEAQGQRRAADHFEVRNKALTEALRHVQIDVAGNVSDNDTIVAFIEDVLADPNAGVDRFVDRAALEKAEIQRDEAEQAFTSKVDELQAMRAMVDDLRAQLAEARADVVAAAGELMIDIPEPGTDLARCMVASRLLRVQRDEAHAALAEVTEKAQALQAEVARLTSAKGA